MDDSILMLIVLQGLFYFGSYLYYKFRLDASVKRREKELEDSSETTSEEP